jgi:hypothetical protein
MSLVTVFFLSMQCVSAHVRYNKLRADDLLLITFGCMHGWEQGTWLVLVLRFTAFSAK